MSERVMTILAGASRKLPDRRAHELFEERVRERPEAVASVRGSRQLTYGEVNARANKVARALTSPYVSCLEPRTLATASGDRKSTRLNSSHIKSSYAAFCLKKKN